MHRRWLLSVGVCALTVWGIRGVSTKPVKADGVAHVAEFVGGDLRGEVSRAQQRYLHTQPHHWRQLMIKN
jgi:hypothetical protein